MTFHDLIEISFRNLWRSKLRTLLTTAGVVIAIATFVAMLSFAAGNHRYFTRAYHELGLINQMSVTPRTVNSADTTEAAVLDSGALTEISKIPGVELAYPYSVFDVEVAVLDTSFAVRARALPRDAVRTAMFSKILGGADFSSESAHEVIVTHEFVDLLKTEPDSLLGKELVISMKVSRLDSALTATMDHPSVEVGNLLRSVDEDSINDQGYRRRFIRRELSSRIGRFISGLMERQASVLDTLIITGIAPGDASYGLRTSPVVIPERTARRLSSGGIVTGGNPADLLMSLREGTLFKAAGDFDSRSYPRVTLVLEPLANHKTVKDSLQAMGFSAFSFAEQFDNMQRFMVYYYLGLGIIGVIALVTAALGIINTLVMSITERRREIGILKSLGGYENDIRSLFLVESAAIGAVGSTAGIVVGWIGTRVVAVIMRALMQREDIPVFDPFALPVWLVFLAFAFGLLISVLAGLFPAARAARVDPVEALRTE
jgi:ABC-type antimicrobial peptide transport system permease subunit